MKIKIFSLSTFSEVIGTDSLDGIIVNVMQETGFSLENPEYHIEFVSPPLYFGNRAEMLFSTEEEVDINALYKSISNICEAANTNALQMECYSEQEVVWRSPKIFSDFEMRTLGTILNKIVALGYELPKALHLIWYNLNQFPFRYYQYPQNNEIAESNENLSMGDIQIASFNESERLDNILDYLEAAIPAFSVQKTLNSDTRMIEGWQGTGEDPYYDREVFTFCEVEARSTQEAREIVLKVDALLREFGEEARICYTNISTNPPIPAYELEYRDVLLVEHLLQRWIESGEDCANSLEFHLLESIGSDRIEQAKEEILQFLIPSVVCPIVWGDSNLLYCGYEQEGSILTNTGWKSKSNVRGFLPKTEYQLEIETAISAMDDFLEKDRLQPLILR